MVAIWKGRHIYFARRITFIKSIISITPLYFLSIFKIPLSMGKIIRRIRRGIFMGMEI